MQSLLCRKSDTSSIGPLDSVAVESCRSEPFRASFFHRRVRSWPMMHRWCCRHPCQCLSFVTFDISASGFLFRISAHKSCRTITKSRTQLLGHSEDSMCTRRNPSATDLINAIQPKLIDKVVSGILHSKFNCLCDTKLLYSSISWKIAERERREWILTQFLRLSFLLGFLLQNTVGWSVFQLHHAVGQFSAHSRVPSCTLCIPVVFFWCAAGSIDSILVLGRSVPFIHRHPTIILVKSPIHMWRRLHCDNMSISRDCDFPEIYDEETDAF